MTDEVKRRLAALEDAVGRIQRVLGSVEEGLDSVRNIPAACSRCGDDFRFVSRCFLADCPIGLYDGGDA